MGLRSYQQAQLKAQPGCYPEIKLTHFDYWGFAVMHADIVVIGVDTQGGQETLDMLRSFTGEKEPQVVTFSENTERVHSFLERTAANPQGVRGRSPATFYQRLQMALRKAGIPDAVLEDLSQPSVETPSVEGRYAGGGIRWTG